MDNGRARAKLANIDGTLNGVSCATTTYCIAVGTSTAGVASYTLIETFDGRAWSAAKSPSPLGYTGLPEDVLYAVSCVGPTFCVAVGTYQSHTGKNLALIETFGLASAPTRWTVSSAPNPTPRRQTTRRSECPALLRPSVWRYWRTQAY